MLVTVSVVSAERQRTELSYKKDKTKVKPRVKSTGWDKPPDEKNDKV